MVLNCFQLLYNINEETNLIFYSGPSLENSKDSSIVKFTFKDFNPSVKYVNTLVNLNLKYLIFI